MDSQIFIEPPLPHKFWKIPMRCWHFHNLHFHIFMLFKSSAIDHSGYGVGYNWGGHDHFSKDN